MEKKALTLALFAVICTACNQFGPERAGSREIKVKVSDASKYETKAAGTSDEPRVFTGCHGELSVYEYVTEYSAALVKGAEISTQNLASRYGSFRVDAYLETDAEEKHFIENMPVVNTAGRWMWETDETPVWRDGIRTIFWSHAPEYSLEIDDYEPDQASFSYEPVLDGKSDFSNTSDMLLAFNSESRDYGEDGTLKEGESNYYDTRFFHALAALKFGLVFDGIADNVDIQDITLSGLYLSGHCRAIGSGSGSGQVEFNWGKTGETGSITETVDKEQLSEGYCMDGDGVLFIMPQSTDNVTITVTFVKFGKLIRKSLVLAAPENGWKAGKCYTYLLKAIVHVPGEEIDIDYSFNFKGFKNDGGIRKIGPFETVGATKIGVVLDQNYKESSGFGSAEYYIESLDGSKNSKGNDIDYDFLPLPATESFPYSGGDGIAERYTGTSQVTSLNKGDKYHVFDVSGYDAFYIVCHSTSSANDGRWSGNFQKMYFLDVEDTL